MIRLKELCISVAVSVLLTALIGAGVLQHPDKWVQDSLYQRGSTASTDIIIIGIDEYSLAELGPYNTWDRSVMASALEVLGSDPSNLPAVVAIDTLYTNYTDSEGDKRLVEAASNIDNIVFASVAQFGTTYEYVNNVAKANSYSVINYETPYKELIEVSYQGHINAMEDIDGIMRHGVLYVEPEENQRIYSMAYTAADLYLSSRGEKITEPPTNRRGQFYVPFTAAPFTYYDGVSLVSLIRGEVPASYYAGKIVLIGPYATGLKDSYFTPIDKSTQMYGVEFQANVIQSFIDGNFKKELSNVPQLIILFVLVTIIIYGLLRSKLRLGLFLSLFGITVSIVSSLLIYNFGYVIHALWLPVCIVIAYFISIVNRYSIAKAEKGTIKKSFERYVAPDIVNEILKADSSELSFVGKTSEIAVLFVDVRGFTTMSERLEPEVVVSILNRYLSKVVDCIDSNSGTLDKFVGDAVMAFWGAPLPQENSIENACKAAMDIIKGVDEISQQIKEEMGEEIHVGVGVHYGPAVVGNMGSPRRMDYTAIGDTVNTAARLESNAPAGKIYISRVVADKLGTKATFNSLGDTITLKGKAEGFEVIELTGLEA